MAKPSTCTKTSSAQPRHSFRNASAIPSPSLPVTLSIYQRMTALLSNHTRLGLRSLPQTPTKCQNREFLQPLVDAYVLVDELCMEGACNDLAEAIKRLLGKYYTRCSHLKGWRACSFPGNPLRLFLVEQLAWDISCRPEMKLNTHTGLKDFICEGGVDVWDVLRWTLPIRV